MHNIIMFISITPFAIKIARWWIYNSLIKMQNIKYMLCYFKVTWYKVDNKERHDWTVSSLTRWTNYIKVSKWQKCFLWTWRARSKKLIYNGMCHTRQCFFTAAMN